MENADAKEGTESSPAEEGTGLLFRKERTEKTPAKKNRKNPLRMNALKKHSEGTQRKIPNTRVHGENFAKEAR